MLIILSIMPDHFVLRKEELLKFLLIHGLSANFENLLLWYHETLRLNRKYRILASGASPVLNH